MIKPLYSQCTRGLISVWEIKSHMPCGIARKRKQKILIGASLVFQWLRILPTQGTRVRFLVQEDPTCGEQLSPRATTTKSVLPSLSDTVTEPVLWSLGLHLPDSRVIATEPHAPCSPSSTTREIPSLRSQHTASRESPCTAMKTQHGHK